MVTARKRKELGGGDPNEKDESLPSPLPPKAIKIGENGLVHSVDDSQKDTKIDIDMEGRRSPMISTDPGRPDGLISSESPIYDKHQTLETNMENRTALSHVSSPSTVSQKGKNHDRGNNRTLANHSPRDSTMKITNLSVESNGIPYPPNTEKGVTSTKSLSPGDILEEKEDLDPVYVGRVIGKSGEMIRDLQARSACQIDVDQNVHPSEPRIILYRGTRKNIDFAKSLVHILCSDLDKGGEFDLPLGEAKQKVLTVPASCIGKLIGRKGDMIRELQIKSQAKIQVDHSNVSGDPKLRQITLIGSEISVDKAEKMILFIIDNPLVDSMTALSMLTEDKTTRSSGSSRGKGSYQMMYYSGSPLVLQDEFSNRIGNSQEYHPGVPVNNNYRITQEFPHPTHGYDRPHMNPFSTQSQPPIYVTETELFLCHKQYMGRIIGKQGVTINDVQRRSGCEIQINQNVPQGHDCEINIKGTRAGIDSAKNMLTEIIRLGQNHPYAGGSLGGQRQGMSQQTSMIPPPNNGISYIQQPYNTQPHYAFAGYAPWQYLSHQNYVGIPMNSGLGVTWKSAFAPDGQTYYYNDRGETTWEKPPGFL